MQFNFRFHCFLFNFFFRVALISLPFLQVMLQLALYVKSKHRALENLMQRFYLMKRVNAVYLVCSWILAKSLKRDERVALKTDSL